MSYAPCLTWWRHQMETFSALLAICAGNSPVTGEFPSQRTVPRRTLIFFYDLRLNKRMRNLRRHHANDDVTVIWEEARRPMTLSPVRCLIEVIARSSSKPTKGYLDSQFMWWLYRLCAPHTDVAWLGQYTVKPISNDHLMGYYSAFWSSSRWPLAT